MSETEEAVMMPSAYEVRSLLLAAGIPPSTSGDGFWLDPAAPDGGHLFILAANHADRAALRERCLEVLHAHCYDARLDSEGRIAIGRSLPRAEDPELDPGLEARLQHYYAHLGEVIARLRRERDVERIMLADLRIRLRIYARRELGRWAYEEPIGVAGCSHAEAAQWLWDASQRDVEGTQWIADDRERARRLIADAGIKDVADILDAIYEPGTWPATPDKEAP